MQLKLLVTIWAILLVAYSLKDSMIMVAEIVLGLIVGGHALKEIARDRNVRNKLQRWADEAGEKAKKYGSK